MNWRSHITMVFGLLLVTMLSAQDYERVDATIQLYPTQFEGPDQLAALIERDFTSEEDKVRAIYTWLIQNVTYEPSEYDQFDYSFKNYRDRNLKDEQLRKKIIQRTLQKGIAVCEGYAMTFEKLCELTGINNYLVRGDTKSSFDDIGREFKKNHMWNVAVIDSTPFLFDPTWGAGKHDGNQFIKDPTYAYYKIAPDQLIKTHYPAMKEDTFLSRPMSQEAYRAMPIIIDRNLYMEDIISPQEGLIRKEKYPTSIPFQIRTKSPKRVSYSYGSKEKKLAFKKEQKTITFEIPKRSGDQNLVIYFDSKPVLAYKLK